MSSTVLRINQQFYRKKLTDNETTKATVTDIGAISCGTTYRYKFKSHLWIDL